MKVRQEVIIEVEPQAAWNWLSELEQLATVNMFHGPLHFGEGPRSGPGTCLIMLHGLKIGGWMPFGIEREARITQWRPGQSLGWVELDPKAPKSRFPHSQTFTLETVPGLARHTRLVNELRGSLNLPIGRFGYKVEELFGRYWVRWVLKRECRALKRKIEYCFK